MEHVEKDFADGRIRNASVEADYHMFLDGDRKKAKSTLTDAYLERLRADILA